MCIRDSYYPTISYYYPTITYYYLTNTHYHLTSAHSYPCDYPYFLYFFTGTTACCATVAAPLPHACAT